MFPLSLPSRADPDVPPLRAGLRDDARQHPGALVTARLQVPAAARAGPHRGGGRRRLRQALPRTAEYLQRPGRRRQSVGEAGQGKGDQTV